MNSQCAFYGGTKKRGKKTLLQCGEHALINIGDEDTSEACIAASQDICLGRSGQSHLDCRAFLITSIQGKQVNVASDHTIPELQRIYAKVKDRAGCENCEFYWWSAGYDNAAEPSKLSGYEGWKEWQSRKIPCEIFTHYCRPEYNVLHEITAGDLWFCIRTPASTEQKENHTMPEITTLTAAPPQEVSPEYQQAISLHNQIIGNVEAAASAMISLCQNLKQMRDTCFYTHLGYENFEDYTEQAVGIKRRQAYTYITVLEKLPSHILQSNAHLGITKLELLTQVPALEREEFVEEYSLDGLSTREIREILEKYNQQAKQLSLLQDTKSDLERENTDLADKNAELIEKNDELASVSWQEAESTRKIDELQRRLQEEKARADELERRPIDVAVQEPDAEMLERIREDTRAAVEVEAAAKIKAAEKSAREEAEKAAEERIDKAVEDATQEAEQRFQASLAVMEEEKGQAMARALELEKKLKGSGDTDIVRLSVHFDELQATFTKIITLIDGVRANNPDTADKYAAALVRALDALKIQIL